MSRGRTFAIAVGVLACVLALPAGNAVALQWNVTQLSEESSTLFGVSCPSTSFCVLVGSNSTVATSQDPAGGTSAWQPGHLLTGEHIGESGTGLYSGGQVRGVSCPSPSFCAAGSRQGVIFASTQPNGGAFAWKPTPLQPEHKPRVHVYGLSCPSTGLCVGVALGGNIVTSTDPLGGSASWKVTEIGQPIELTGVSCPTAALCLAVGSEGSVIASTNPGAGAASWTSVTPAGGLGLLLGVSCPTPTLCLTGNDSSLFVSTDPTAPSSWQTTPDVTPLQTTAFSCPTASACAAVNNNADVITSTNPTGGSGAWSFVNAIPIPPNGIFGLSCATRSLCVGVGARGQIISSTNPFGETESAVREGIHPRRRTVKITRHPRRLLRIHGRRAQVSFRFRAIGPSRGFLCKIDRHRYSRCRSPKRYPVDVGRHAFRVKAFEPGGIDQTPSVFRFRVVRTK